MGYSSSLQLRGGTHLGVMTLPNYVHHVIRTTLFICTICTHVRQYVPAVTDYVGDSIYMSIHVSYEGQRGRIIYMCQVWQVLWAGRGSHADKCYCLLHTIKFSRKLYRIINYSSFVYHNWHAPLDPHTDCAIPGVILGSLTLRHCQYFLHS